MKKYKITTLIFGIAMFFGIGVIDKVVAQSKWDVMDIMFTILFCLFTSIYLGRHKNNI